MTNEYNEPKTEENPIENTISDVNGDSHTYGVIPLKDKNEDAPMKTIIVRKCCVNGMLQTIIVDKDLQFKSVDYGAMIPCIVNVPVEDAKNPSKNREYSEQSETFGSEQTVLNFSGDRVSRLMKKNKKIKSELDEMKKSLHESKQTISTLKTIKDEQCLRLKRLECGLDDMSQTNRHLRAEMKRMQSVNVQGIVKFTMEFVARINNSSLDSKDTEQLKNIIQSNIQMLMSDLDSCGLDVTFHERNSPVPDDNVEINEKITSEKDLDSKICKTTRFGASFKNDVYPRITEEVSVYRYKEP